MAQGGAHRVADLCDIDQFDAAHHRMPRRRQMAGEDRLGAGLRQDEGEGKRAVHALGDGHAGDLPCPVAHVEILEPDAGGDEILHHAERSEGLQAAAPHRERLGDGGRCLQPVDDAERHAKPLQGEGKR